MPHPLYCLGPCGWPVPDPSLSGCTQEGFLELAVCWGKRKKRKRYTSEIVYRICNFSRYPIQDKCQILGHYFPWYKRKHVFSCSCVFLEPTLLPSGSCLHRGALPSATRAGGHLCWPSDVRDQRNSVTTVLQHSVTVLQYIIMCSWHSIMPLLPWINKYITPKFVTRPKNLTII